MHKNILIIKSISCEEGGGGVIYGIIIASIIKWG